MSEELILLAKIWHPLEAQLLKTKLESAGIECYLDDENIVNLNQLYSYVVGHIKVKVKNSDFEKAKEFLKKEKLLLKKDRKAGEKLGVVPCPKCNSKILSSDRLSLPFIFISIFLVGIPILLRRKKWTCNECNFTWREPFYFYKFFFSFFLLIIAVIIWFSIIAYLKKYITFSFKENYYQNLLDDS